MTFASRWPDGRVLTSWSPSLVVSEHLEEGARYPVEEFLRRCSAALTEGSERVRARYGMPCRRALSALAEIEGLARRCPADGEVEVIAMERP